MNLITAPIQMGQQGEQVKNLQEVLLWFIQEEHMQVPPDQLNAMVDEMYRSFYGTGTNTLLLQLTEMLGVDGRNGVDENVANAINAAIPQRQEQREVKVSGLLRNDSGKPITGLPVEVFIVTLRERWIVAEAQTDERGFFSTRYMPSFVGDDHKGVQVVAYVPTPEGQVASPVIFNVNEDVYVELTASVEASSQIIDEYQSLKAKVFAAAGPHVNSLSENDTAFIAGNIGENEILVRMFLLAQAHASRTGIAAEAFYGIMRKTELLTLEAIFNIPTEDIISTLQYAVAVNIIAHFDQATIDNFTAAIKSASAIAVFGDAHEAPENSKSYRILSSTLTSDIASAFLQYYYKNDTAAPDFWDDQKIRAEVPGMTSTGVAQLKRTITHALITGSNPAMTRVLQNTAANTLAGKTQAEWEMLINSNRQADFVFPDYIQGESDSERVENYAASLKDNYNGAFRTEAIQQQIQGDQQKAFPTLYSSLSTFTANNPGFDLLRTPVSAISSNEGGFNLSGISNVENFVEELSTTQRLSVVTSSYKGMAALQSNGLTSAKAITQLSQQDFVQSYGSALGGSASANIAYNNAVTAVMVSQALSLNAYQSINFNIPSIYTPPPDANPDWRSLFGNVDFCTCDNCMSVFSPAAYFVDSLELLRKYNTGAYNWLKAKRPDLWNIKLTCKNTNTPLPYIDLANELLEDLMVVAGTNASTTPGQPLYPIQAHDTTLSEQTLRAIPQYINSTGTAPTLPYNKLKAAKYPWTAPYNYFYEQGKEYLSLIDMKPYQPAQTFTGVPAAFTLNNIDLACSYLGITRENPGASMGEYSIITDGTSTLLRTYYGVTGSNIVNPANRSATIGVPSGTLVPVSPAAPFLNRVDILMQQSGLTFTDILELLDCYYINPITSTSPVTRRLKISAIPETACDTSKMKIDGLTEADLLIIHRFIRLQRHTGWNKYELDRTFKMLNVAAGANITDNILISVAQLKRMTEILNCNIDDLLPLWGDIGHMAYSKYVGDKPELIPTQYELFFRNQAVVPNYDQIVGYPFIADMASWKASSAGATTAILQSQLDYVMAAFQISEQDFDKLFRFFHNDASLSSVFLTAGTGEFSFNYANVLGLLREFTLARLLQVDIDDWCLFRSWLKSLSGGIDPFVYSGSTTHLSASLLFIEKVRMLRNSNLSAKKLNYLFMDRFGNDADKAEKQEVLFTRYQDLRTLLSKLNTSVSASGTIDAKALLTKVDLVMDTADASFIVDYVANLSSQSGSTTYTFSAEDASRLNRLLPDELSAAEKSAIALQLVGVPTSTAYTLTAKADRLKLVNTIYTRAALKGQVRHYLSTTYKSDLAVSELLLNKQITAGTATDAYEALISEEYITSTGAPATTVTYAKNALLALERFDKAVQLASGNNLSATDMAFFLERKTQLSIPDIANLPAGNVWNNTPASTAVATDAWTMLIEWLNVRELITPSPTGLVTVLNNLFNLSGGAATPAGRKQAWFDSMVQAVQISEDDLQVLIGPKNNVSSQGILNLDFALGMPHLQPESYRKLINCLDMRAVLEVNMNSCVNIANAVLHPQTQADADFVVQSVKARYSNNEWLEQSRPANDRLRTGRRDAMVAYLLAFPPLAYRNEWITANDIFETLLTDTSMMPVVQTSRIKQAISTVQLFIDRCILQKENDLSNNLQSLSPDTIRQWNLWRKWYRIWEANRKIFIYPENWIEPDLRDDKSPFFKDLEKFLKQNEITSLTMEDAYRTYLERLDEVAHLEVIGYYTEDIMNGTTVTDTVVHVWGRTRSNPHIYYYRKRVAGSWTAWEKMETQIDGDNFAPVKWRGRLRLYWLTFTEQVREKISKIAVSEEPEYQEKYWKIELSWTELKNGKWQPKQVGREWLETDPYGPARLVDIQWNYGNTYSWTPDMKPYTLATFKDSFNSLRESMVPYVRVNSDNELEVIVHGRKKYSSQSDLNTFIDGKHGSAPLYRYNISHPIALFPTSVWVNALMGLFDMNAYKSYTEEYYFSYPVKYEEFKGRFTVKHNKVHADRYNVPHTFYDTLVESFPYKPEESQYSYIKAISQGYEHLTGTTTKVKLLNQAPQFSGAPNPEKYLVFSRVVPQNNNGTYVSFPKFFYKDFKNSFFVEKVSLPPTLQLSASTTTATQQYTALATGFNIQSGSGGISNGTISQAGQGSGTLVLSGSTGTTGTIAQLAMTTAYRFYPFYHYRVNNMMDQLDRYGLDGLFSWDFISSNTTNDDLNFQNTYLPTTQVLHYLPQNQTNPDHDVYPKSTLDFAFDSPSAIYNWELFFHIPLLIATRLMQDQKFTEAMQWFHYVFNPTNKSQTSHGNGAERFWQFYPFYKESLQGIPTIDQIMTNPNLQNAVQQWANDPFKPHLVARTRFSAYMKNVLMKYLDNLVAWGDQLFRRDTMESINEATLLYILAAQLLGRPPVKMPSRVAAAPKSYADMVANPANMNAFSNAIVQVETVLAPTGASQQYTGGATNPLYMFYFCIPPNSKLLGYWDIIADRLFKIRNSQNIDGVERQLALFEPPIDPALLVRAAASGISLSDAVNELFAPLPQYRFSVMVQKATELAQEVKSLGGNLLSAIEKKDAEHISLLRNSHEISVLEAAKEVREMQLQEAQTQISALTEQKNIVTVRRNYYNTLIEKGLNTHEQAQLNSLQLSIPLKVSQGALQALAGMMHVIPNFKLAAPFSLGTTFGGENLGNLTNAIATSVGITATVNDIQGSMAGIKAGHARRSEEWEQQRKTADAELKQIERQLVAAEIRAAIAEKELANHNLQYKNAQELDQAMHDKYSNEDLYDWMISQISLTYFQSYKLAFDVAKRAERSYSYELGTEPTTPFIQFGYWDSLKKGLLAGEGLLYDIKRMDISYLDLNKRQHEMTKHISLAAIDADALIRLKAGEAVPVNLPEWLFDMDYPGHYMRRIKSVSLSIPCVAGPYTTISAKLTLNSSRYRKNPVSGSTTPYPEVTANDSRFVYMFGGGQSIATSSAQNDSGLFEMNFRDERYLPFEGAGVISDWTLELPSKYASFDAGSITDVIIHVNYTAKYDGGLATDANNNVAALIANATAGAKLPKLFNLKQEFADEWTAYVTAVQNGNMNATLSLPIRPDLFPYFCKGKTITLSSALFKATRVDNTINADIVIKRVTGSPVALTTLNTANGYKGTGTLGTTAIDNQFVLKLNFSSSSATTPAQLAAILRNMDSLWLAAIYSVS